MIKTVSVIKQTSSDNSGYVDIPMNERISLVWPLTREAVSLSKKYNAKQRLQRHITQLIRQKG
jgi:hypothetical protein